jgi:hypothetical protein
LGRNEEGSHLWLPLLIASLLVRVLLGICQFPFSPLRSTPPIFGFMTFLGKFRFLVYGGAEGLNKLFCLLHLNFFVVGWKILAH